MVKRRFCARRIGQEQKNLFRGGQKMRWCPEIGAGTKKLSTSGQKLRWCPETGAGTKKLSTAGPKLPFVPTQPCTNAVFWPQLAPKCRLCSQNSGCRCDYR
ncbi:MAG: hypothetical protein QM296_11000 [Bacillota bacterium]|nr:hypothetical protein [Bacillota bacterium]